MKLSEHLTESGVDPETLLKHLKWSVNELTNREDPNEPEWKFKKKVMIQNTGTLIYHLERELMELPPSIGFTPEE